MSNRFDLEQMMMDCWGVTDDLRILTEAILDQELDRDKIANILIGMEQLYQLKFEKCQKVFEQCIHNREI